MSVLEPLSLVIAFTTGSLSFLSPCVLPLFPSYLSFITGMSLDRLRSAPQPRERRIIVVHSLLFICGFSVVFVGMGASFSALGQLLVDHRGTIRIGGGALIIFFGLYIAGLFKLPWLNRTFQLPMRDRQAGFLGSVLVGMTFAVGWTPCVGPILGSILSLAGTAETIGRGVAMLVAYSLGLGLPFFLSSLAVGTFLTLFQRYRRIVPVFEVVAGGLLVVVGFLVMTNYFVLLNIYAISLTPQWLLRRL